MRGIIAGLLKALASAAMAIAIAGCSARDKQPAPLAASSPDQSAANSAPPPGPEAKIHINYSKPGDFLSTIMLTKYSGANVLTTQPDGTKGVASVIRFEGGMPVWQIGVQPGMFSEIPMGLSTKNYAVDEVKYGDVPPHFAQIIPDSGPPEPLEADNFYVFSVTRDSGSVSYEAVKVSADGSLESYEADPRAGTSFRLCCNVASDFTSVAPPTDADTSTVPPDTSASTGSSSGDQAQPQ